MRAGVSGDSNQGVSRELCEAFATGQILSGDWRKALKDIARAHLALLDECENLRRGWRPIETAPTHDGKKLIVWADGEIGVWYKDAYYSKEIGRGYEEGMSGWVDQEGIARYDSPTHWMPLPDPPYAAISENAANAPVYCKICGWPLAASRDLGCVEGDCSYRPEDGSPEWYRIKARRDALASEVESAQDSSVSGAGQ